MQPGKRPRNLRDISHLYLSSSQAARREAVRAPALVLLAATGRGPMRAYLSAGLAVAFENQGAAVTLLETGPGLPCAGFYFALEPERYLGPALDPGSVVEADAGRSIKIIYSRDPLLLGSASPNAPVEGSHAVLLVSFDWPAGGGRTSLGELLDAIPALSPSEGHQTAGWRDLQAFLLAVSDSAPSAAESIVREFRSLYPDAPGLRMASNRFEDRPAGGDIPGMDPCFYPEGLVSGVARRVPPVSDFLSGVAVEVLLRLGSRKKGGAGNEA